MLLINDRALAFTKFPDGTSSLRIETVGDKGDRRTVFWRYESEEEMVALYYITRHLKDAGYKVDLLMPYIPNARMDRVKNSDEVFTLKYFADFINFLQFETVYVRDPHSNVSSALINNLKIDKCKSFIESSIRKIADNDLVLYYPDEGAMKRYSDLMDGYPYTFGVKRRDWRSGEILGITLIDESVVRDKNVLIVDDICSMGGTFLHSAKALKSAGVKDIYLYVTHCENTILQGKLLDSDLIKRVFTTNSILTKSHEKITVLNNDEENEVAQ